MPRLLLSFALTSGLWLVGCAAADDRAADAARPGQAAQPPAAAGGNVDLPRFPSISPDGSEIVFSWRGDLWKAPAQGGHALRLTSHPADEGRSAWSRDGRRVAFNSTRTGFSNIHTMNADGTDVRQVTNIDQSCILAAYGLDPDGEEVITFWSRLEGDVYRAARPYLVSVDGGDLVRLHGAFGEEPAVSPDGSKALFTRGGSSWTRRHYRGPDDRDVWLYDRADGSFTQLTTWEGNDGQARWLDDDTILYLSDREDNTVNLYRMDLDRGEAGAVRLTAFAIDDVQDFDVAAGGSTAVLAAWDTLYTLDLTRRNAEPEALTINANEDERDNFEIRTIGRDVSEAALSPDGQVMACVAYGEVYVRNIDERSPTRRVTNSHAREKDIAWSPDGVRLYFTSDEDGSESIYMATVELTRGEIVEAFRKATEPPPVQAAEAAPQPEVSKEEPGAEPAAPADEPAGAAKEGAQPPDAQEKDQPAKDDKDEKDEKEEKEPEVPREFKPERWHDAVRFTITPVVAAAEHHDRRPNPSPDGRTLLFRRGRGDLVVRDLFTGEERVIVAGWDTDTEARWSYDSRLIAYHQSDMDFNSDIWIVPADGSSAPVNITRHPDNDSNPRWSADGKVLSFLSQRVGDESDVWMVYLDKAIESYTPRELFEYYDNAAKEAKKRKAIKPVRYDQPAPEPAKQADLKLDLDDAWLRLRRVTRLTGGEGGNEMTPAGDYYVFTGATDESGLFSVKWDGSELKRITTSVSVQHMNAAGDKVVFVSSGRAGVIPPAGGKVDNYDIADRMRIDLQAQSSQKFREAARILGEMFYHPTMKDLDWPALTLKYHALARKTRTADEFNHVAARFLGELNGSHLGITARGETSPNALPMGRLGIDARRDGDRFAVTKVVAFGPAAVGPMALQVGDRITAIDRRPFEGADTLESRLQGRAGEEVIVTVDRTLDDGSTASLDVLLTPVSAGAERGLRYDDWRLTNARLVEEWSDGQLGYIHIEGMNQPALDVFERDLFAAAGGRKGLIIDVRNNGGGWTTDRLLASIAYPQHAYTIPRGADPTKVGHYPQDRLFIQRYTLPINMLCNEKSFSNAEIISHAFKTIRRGTLVGQQTYGGVISTGGTSLIDGTFVRLPFRGWYLPDGTDMENNGAVPDILVPQTPEAESRDDDEQLRAAVEDLLKRIN